MGAKIKSYNFWIKLASASLLLIRLVGSKLGFEIDGLLFMDIVTAVAGILVVMGIISAPTVVAAKEGGTIMENNLETNVEESAVQVDLVSDEQTGFVDDEKHIVETNSNDEKHIVETNSNDDNAKTEFQNLQNSTKTSENSVKNDDFMVNNAENHHMGDSAVVRNYIYKDGIIEEVSVENGESEDLNDYSHIETIVIDNQLSMNQVSEDKLTTDNNQSIPCKHTVVETNEIATEDESGFVESGKLESNDRASNEQSSNNFMPTENQFSREFCFEAENERRSGEEFLCSFENNESTESADASGESGATENADASGETGSSQSADASGETGSTESADASGETGSTESADASGETGSTEYADARKEFDSIKSTREFEPTTFPTIELQKQLGADSRLQAQETSNLQNQKTEIEINKESIEKTENVGSIEKTQSNAEQPAFDRENAVEQDSTLTSVLSRLALLIEKLEKI